MAYRNSTATSAERVHQQDELFVTQVESVPVGQFTTRVSVTMEVNREAVRERFGVVLGSLLVWAIVHRAASTYTGALLVDLRAPSIAHDSGFRRLGWRHLALPPRGAIVAQPYFAAFDQFGIQTRSYMLQRLLAVGIDDRRSDAEAAVRDRMHSSHAEVGARVWREDAPPVPPEATLVLGGLGRKLAEDVGTQIARALRWPLVKLAVPPEPAI
jgi:hypothetical protein